MNIIWPSLAFGLVFGALLQYAGIRRLLGAAKDERPIEAVVWGSIGMALGLAMFVAAAWLAWKSLPTRGSARP